MAIMFMEGFDHYGPGAPSKSDGPSFATRRIAAGNDEPYGFEWADDEGHTFAIRVERTDAGTWRMTVKGEGELTFSQRPTFLASPTF